MPKIGEGDIVSHHEELSGLELFGRVYRVIGNAALVRFSDVLEKWVGLWALRVEQQAEAV